MSHAMLGGNLYTTDGYAPSFSHVCAYYVLGEYGYNSC